MNSMSVPNVIPVILPSPVRVWPLAILFLGLVSFAIEVNAQDVRSGPGCIYNCLNEKTKGWLAGKIPGYEDLLKIKACKDGLYGDAGEFIKCVNSLFTEIPGVGEIIEAGKCVYDCRNCSAENPDQCPEKWSCVDGTYCWCSKSGTDFRSKLDTELGKLLTQPNYQCKTCEAGQWGAQRSYNCFSYSVCHDHPPGDFKCEERDFKCNWKGLPLE